MREEEAVQQQLDEATVWTSQGITQYRAMTYEDGVASALRWVLGEQEEPPIEVED